MNGVALRSRSFSLGGGSYITSGGETGAVSYPAVPAEVVAQLLVYFMG